MTAYVLTRKRDDEEDVRLCSSEWKAIKTSVKDLYFILSLEELMSLITDAIFEWEQELVNSVLNDFIYSPKGGFKEQEKKLLLNRRLLTVLTSTKTYLDFVGRIREEQQEVSKNILNLSGQFRRLSDTYTRNSFSSSFLLELRNYSQHRSIPITNVGRHITITQGQAPDVEKYKIRAILKAYEINKDKRLKDFLYENNMSEKDVDIEPYVRTFVGTLSELHYCLRDNLDSYYTDACSCISRNMDRYFQANPEHSNYPLYVEELTEDGEVSDTILIPESIQNDIERLRVRNQRLSNLKNQSLTITAAENS